MATVPIQWREPESFVSGDTLLFQRNLPNYLPSDGWAIRLTITQSTPAGAGANSAVEVAQVVSAPDAGNTFHCFKVANFCAGLDAGTYVISEEVFNAAGNAGQGIAAGTKHQIYFRPDFLVQDDLDAGLASGPQLTEAQEMIALITATLKQLYALKFAETEDLRSRFRLQDQTKALADLKFWKAMRQQEIQQENVANGRQSGATAMPVFVIG